MVDRDLILLKAGSVRNHLKRIQEKRPESLEQFLGDQDRQDIVLFNLQMAIQNCIDIAAHIISDEGFGVPGSTNEMFYLLEKNGYFDYQLSENMVKAVGFRNLVVHEYGKIDLKLVYNVTATHLDDLVDYLKAVFQKAGIAGDP